MSEAQTVVDGPEVGRDLTAFQRNILVILSEESMYGLAIKRALEEYYGTEVNHGRLYPNLDELVEMGLVEKGELDERTNEYTLTEAGERVLIDRLDWTLSKFVTGEERAETVTDLVRRHR
ncbi:MAG: PadR family transcriptional regulator [Haloferacaceae archaeon]